MWSTASEFLYWLFNMNRVNCLIFFSSTHASKSPNKDDNVDDDAFLLHKCCNNVYKCAIMLRPDYCCVIFIVDGSRLLFVQRKFFLLLLCCRLSRNNYNVLKCSTIWYIIYLFLCVCKSGSFMNTLAARDECAPQHNIIRNVRVCVCWNNNKNNFNESVSCADIFLSFSICSFFYLFSEIVSKLKASHTHADTPHKYPIQNKT